jgi:ornithine cyclodeaminase
MSRVRILGKDDVERLMPVAECIEPMERVLTALTRGELLNPLRTFVRPADTRVFMALMPSYRPHPPAFGLKSACVSPENTARGLDTHQGFIALFDGVTGETRAIVNAGAVTSIRTAAVSALATRLLARPDSRTLAILGAGTQARSHLEGMRAVLPFERVLVWNRTPGRAAELEGVEEAPTVAAALADADVVVTVTASVEPIVSRAWLKEGAHINAVGSAKPTTRELDSETMAAAALYVDRRESALNEPGDYLFAAADGAIGPEHIRGEIGELLLGSVAGRSSQAELTLFKSLGLAVQDLAAAEHVLELAEREDAGSVVEL